MSTSTRQSGVSSRISRIVSAKTRALPMLSSSRFTLVTTACFSPSVATASATRRGSSQSIGSGRPLGTAQKPQRRVQISPSSMNVAVLWFQHSPIFGTLRRLAHRVQPHAPRQFFQIVEVVTHRSFRPQPRRLRSTQRRAQFNLNELGRPGHHFDSISSAVLLSPRPTTRLPPAHTYAASAPAYAPARG